MNRFQEAESMATKKFQRSVDDRRIADRHLKRKIGALLKLQGALRGNLSERLRVCGKPECKCSTGEKHPGLYLVQSREGKTRQIFVPAAWAEDVKQWVSNYQVMRQLLDELSDVWWENIESREL
jgi:hypothetical protein